MDDGSPVIGDFGVSGGTSTENGVSEGKRVLRQAFKRLEQEVPERMGRMLRWLRHPASRMVRIPAGILFILGGVFSIVPGLLPLGLLLVASDVPFLRKPVAFVTIWCAERWAALWERRLSSGRVARPKSVP